MDESLLRELPLFDEKFEDVKLKRSTCAVCARPSTVCVCHAIYEKLHISTKVIVLQHPAEQNRQLRTVPLLKAALEDDKCMIIVGKRFKNLDQLLSVPTALLFPGKDAVECSAVLPGTFKQLVCLDGTWPQARRLYQKNPILHSLPKVMLNSVRKSVYLIHTQPTLQHLSTLESVARAIEDMEKLDGLEEKMVAPLKEMVIGYMYVLTSSPYVCNLFTKQKSELNFDSNEDFILFLLTNTCKLASFANQLNPVLNKLLEYTITDVTCTQSPPKTPLDCSQSPTAPRYKPPASPPQPTASAADIQQILDTFNQNKSDTIDGNETILEETDKAAHEPEAEKSDAHQKAATNMEEEKRQRFHSDSTISETEAMDSSSDSDDLGEPQNVPYPSTSESNTISKEEPARSSHHHQETSPRQVSRDATPSSTTYRPARSPESKDQEEDDRMLFDPADLMQKSTAALQVSDEVMKPHSSLKPPPPPTSHPVDVPPEVRPATQTQRLVLPRQSSPFKSGHLIAVPLAIGNEMKGIPLPPIHPASHSGPGYTTTISQPARPPPVSTSTPKPPHKDAEQNRENLNVTNEMDADNSDKLYICPICNKEFKGSGRVRNCKIHINTVHLKHKPYKCNFCNVRFGYKDYMKRHLIRHHKSLFYSYGTESVLEKYTTYDLEDPSQQEHETRHEGRDQRDTAGL